MRTLRFTISADGSSDAGLEPILIWAIRRYHPKVIPVVQFVDYRYTGKPRGSLAARLQQAVRFFPCEVLVVHRDSESKPWRDREAEIHDAVGELELRDPVVTVVPVRMTEAWLLLDEIAIRRAAGNPSGTGLLNLPAVGRLEQIADPKEFLHQALRTASGFSGRRLRNAKPERQARRVAELIDDFAPLEALEAFVRFRVSLGKAIARFEPSE